MPNAGRDALAINLEMPNAGHDALNIVVDSLVFTTKMYSTQRSSVVV